MELRHLRYFAAVAEALHFGRAADRLHISQPSLSQQMRQLEAEIGVELLKRSTRRVELTAAGTSFLTRAREILTAADEAVVNARRVSAGVEGTLVVGGVGSATYSLLPTFARMMREEAPGIDLSFQGEMTVPELLDALQAKQIDLALLHPFSGDTEPFVLTSLRSEEFIIALPAHHRLAAQPYISVEELRDEDFIMHPAFGRSVMYQTVTKLCRDAGFDPRVRHQVSETSTLLAFVASGLGVAILPESASHLLVHGATYRPLRTDSKIELTAAVRATDDSPTLWRAISMLQRQILDGDGTYE
jgi:DNA-binding transcriptional LysR family regulator